jgi:hypothetical protein
VREKHKERGIKYYPKYKTAYAWESKLGDWCTEGISINVTAVNTYSPQPTVTHVTDTLKLNLYRKNGIK